MYKKNELIPSVTKPDSIRKLGSVDIAQLKALMLRMSETTWDKEDARKENDFDCFHNTRHIIFRFISGNRDHRQSYSNPIWEIWKSVLLPVMEHVTREYGFKKPEYPKAMFARLTAGKIIDVHIDGAGSNLHTQKIHVPLQTNPDAIFTSNGVSSNLEEGQAYEVNNIAPHGVANRGETDRIHFIFEVFEAGA